MIKQYENLLNCREYLRKNLHIFIDAFVEFYGEDKREEIEKKLKEPLYLAYRSPDSLKIILYDLEKEISEDIQTRAIRSSGTLFSAEDLFDKTSFAYQNTIPLYQYHEFYELFKLGPEGREQQYRKDYYESLRRFLPELTEEEFDEMTRTQTVPSKYSQVKSFVKEQIKYYSDISRGEKDYKKRFDKIAPLVHKINPSITEENFSYYLDDPEIIKLNGLAESYESMREEFMERMAKYKQFQEEEKIHRALKEDIQEKYYIQLVEENIDLLKPEDREKFEAFKKEPNRFYNLTEYTRYIFGYSISNNHPLEDFSEDAESIIHDEKNWRSEWVKKNRVEYFKKNGIDLGDNYEDYLQSEEVKRIWPSPEIVKKFRESRNRLLNQYNNEYYENIPSHKEARKEIEALHLVDKGDSFDARIYTAESGLTCVIPNMVLTEEGYRALPLVLLCCNSATGRIDHELVHEMNHVLELAPIPTVEGSHYEILCGWDGSEGTIETEKGEVDTLQKREGKRDYELFSEIINELIAQEVSAIMERKKQFVFDSEEKHAYKGGTNYEHTFFLVRDFYKEFKKEIIESRQNGNIHIIWDKVGKENFDALNELFHEFHEHFSGFKIYGVLQSLMNQEKTEQTKFYFDLYRRSQEIMEKMRKHSMLQEAEEVVIEEVTEDQK